MSCKFGAKIIKNLKRGNKIGGKEIKMGPFCNVEFAILRVLLMFVNIFPQNVQILVFLLIFAYICKVLKVVTHINVINMFSGIVEATAKVVRLEKDQSNLHITMECPFVDELKIDQSVAHNGVCLTVVSKTDSTYTVTAIKETLDKSNLGGLAVGSLVNLERSMVMNGRLDGHIVQGHVDQTAVCVEKNNADGSWYFTFKYDFDSEMAKCGYVTVEKGSVSVNGVSLTVCNSQNDRFSVAIIPYTYENTNFKQIEVGSVVNIEFDIIGKYVSKIASC